MKTYAYSIDWARVGKKGRQIIWHNDPTLGGTFTVPEDVNKIKGRVVRELHKYTSASYEWDYAATGETEVDSRGVLKDVLKDIEVNAFAPCKNSKGNMVRVRACEDWATWVKLAKSH